MKRTHIILGMMIQDIAGQNASSGVSRYDARFVSVQENFVLSRVKTFLENLCFIISTNEIAMGVMFGFSRDLCFHRQNVLLLLLKSIALK